MITLVAIICHLIIGESGPVALCQDEVVPVELMVAGLASDPIPLPYTEIMCRSGGPMQAQDWLMQQQQFKGWYLAKIMCVPGKYVSNKRAEGGLYIDAASAVRASANGARAGDAA